MGLAAPGQREPQCLLGAGLADRAGHADHLGLGPRARGAREIAQAFEHVGHDQEPCVRRQRGVPAGGNDRERGTGFQRGRNEFMAVAAFTGDREKGFAWRDAAAVDRKSRNRIRQSASTFGAHGLCHRLDGPQPLVHADFPSSAAATASWSLNGKRLIADNLAAFMALAGDQQDVAAAKIRDRSADRFAAVADLDCARRGFQDRGANGGGFLAARIVVGDDDAVGLRRSDLTHHRPLAGVAIAAGAEHDDETTGRIGPQRFERLGERVRLVGVVDEDRRAVFFSDQIETPLGAFERGECSEHGCRLAVGSNRKSGSDQCILDLEAADQRQPDGVSAAAVHDLHGLREAVDGSLDQPNALATLSDREQPQTPLLGRRQHGVGMLVIDIDHGGAARLDQVTEQSNLCGEIGLGCRMIVEMVAADIGEAPGRDPHAIEAALVKAV